MTLSELLRNVSFDDLIPTLKEVYNVDTDIYAYRETFDELNLLRPTGQGDGEIKVYRDEEEHYIGVSGCNDIWENLLDLNIRVEDGIQLDNNALAAYILWELTFYGFSQEEMSSFFTNRKRLDRMAKVEDCIQRLLYLSSDIERRDLEYLFDTNSITESNFRQRVGDGDYKPATLYESISKYSLLPQSEYDSVVIVLYSSAVGGVSHELRSSIEDLLITGRFLKRSVIKVCSDSRITDGSIRAFVVTSKDEQ